MSESGVVSPPPSPSSSTSTPPLRSIWREGGLRRVSTAAAVAAAGGAAYASIRHLPPPLILRATASCAIISTPFFALREVVAAGLAVDGPVASAIVGGVAGYVGALAFTSATWRAVSHGAMVVGVGAGLVDAVASSLDYRRRVFLVKWQDRIDNSLRESPGHVGHVGHVGDMRDMHDIRDIRDIRDMRGEMCDMREFRDLEVKHQAVRQMEHSSENGMNGVSKAIDGRDGDVNSNTRKAPTGDWPVWLPIIKPAEDEEYEHLLQSQKATAAALQKEQARIARLLATIERLKADRDTSLPTIDEAAISASPKFPKG